MTTMDQDKQSVSSGSDFEAPHLSAKDYSSVARYFSMCPKMEVALDDLPQFLKKRKQEQAKQKAKWIQKLYRLKIGYNEEQWQGTMLVQLVHESSTKQILVFRVRYGNFFLNISVLNISGNPIISEAEISFLDQDINSSKVIVFQCWQGRVAVKRQSYTKKDFPDKLWAVIKEIFMLKIASALQTGPFMSTYLTFDILIYRSVIQYPMEFCLTQNNMLKHMHPQELDAMAKQYEGWLWQSLHRNHLFRLMHLDIKNQNIGFSKYYNKFVFIDYGLSELIREQLGQRTLIGYRGTLGYSSPQMVLNCSKNIPVDLYYNETYGLQKLVDSFKEHLQKTTNNIEDTQLDVADLTQIYYIYSLKGLLYFQGSNQTIEITRQLLKVLPYYKRNQILLFCSCYPFLYPAFRDIIDLDRGYQLRREQNNFRSYYYRMKKIVYHRPSKLQPLAPPSHIYPHPNLLKQKQLFDDQDNNQPQQQEQALNGIQFSCILNPCDNQLSHDEKLRLSKIFLQLNCIQPQGNPLQQTLVIIYQDSIDSHTVQILRNTLPAIVLMQLVSPQKLKGDMVQFLSYQAPLVEEYKDYLCWVTSLRWIEAKISSCYDWDDLQLTYLQRLRTRVESQKGEVDISMQRLAVVELKMGKMTMPQIRKWLEDIQEEENQKLPALLMSFDWIKALTIYFAFKIWLAQSYSYHFNHPLLRKLLFDSPINKDFGQLQQPYYFHHLIFQYFFASGCYPQYYRFCHLFKTVFGSYSFAKDTLPIFQVSMNRNIRKEGSFGVECQLMALNQLQPPPRYQLLLLRHLVEWVEQQELTATHLKALLTKHNQSIPSFVHLLLTHPYTPEHSHSHYFLTYLDMIVTIGIALFEYYKDEYQIIIGRLQQMASEQSCQLCRQSSSDIMVKLYTEHYMMNKNIKEAWKINQKLLQKRISNNNTQKMVQSLQSLDQIYINSASQIFDPISTILKAVNLTNNVNFFLNNKAMFKRIYFYYMNLNDPTYNQVLTFMTKLLISLERSKQHVYLFHQMLEQLPNQVSYYRTDIWTMLYEQAVISFKLIKQENAYNVIYILRCIYDYWRAKSKINYPHNFKLDQIIKQSSKLLQKLPFHIQEMILGIYYDLWQNHFDHKGKKTLWLKQQVLKRVGGSYNVFKTFGCKINVYSDDIASNFISCKLRAYYANSKHQSSKLDQSFV